MYQKLALCAAFLWTTFVEASDAYKETTISMEDGTKYIRRHYTGEIQSTQDTIIKHLTDVSLAQKQRILITCDKQSGGYGFRKRKWVSPEGNAFLSIGIPHAPEEEGAFFYLHANAVLAVRDTLKDCGLKENFAIRWPYTPMINHKKIAGVLCEQGNESTFIIGIGINVTLSAETAATIDQPVTSILLEKGSALTSSVEDVYAKLLRNVHKRFANLSELQPMKFYEYSHLLAYKGRDVTLYFGEEPTYKGQELLPKRVAVKFLSLDEEEGSINIERNGKFEKYGIGELDPVR